MQKKKEQFSIKNMSKVLGVSESGYYAWVKRPPRKRRLAGTNQRDIPGQSGNLWQPANPSGVDPEGRQMWSKSCSTANEAQSDSSKEKTAQIPENDTAWLWQNCCAEPCSEKFQPGDPQSNLGIRYYLHRHC